MFETHEYRPGSAGEGRYRGGYGGDMRLRVEAEGHSMANTAGEGIVHGARGIGGGHDGAPHDYTLLAPNAVPRKLKSKEINVPVPFGSVLHVLSGGGGGWGDPVATRPGGAAGGHGGGSDVTDPLLALDQTSRTDDDETTMWTAVALMTFNDRKRSATATRVRWRPC